ncbi:hypothetical protein ABB37_03940 [Leptomonas pyrrhocoris]|uniref:Flagellar attachment zone protein 1 conserved domain-containing protein n=1 Tax=Leptomonas pyrrhocoris TaxID=157538 RepID=A0A0M9G3P9_LEPPY|nr:hypothetical protein ABB37_03940 [Leptomonas pyrrhocoris]KPA81607.1 hypothetical protein ABB37_03940 [Leptomonas pyrrhocoris]|eukprot:XP_015660046.1 hypothetical protein ABB37_03940 [Leptomonas pyrrhocoris]
MRREYRAVLQELDAHDDRWKPKDDVSVSTNHRKVFPGDEWELLLKGRELELRSVFVSDAASACHVVQSSVTNVVFVEGSLVVTFSVIHAASVTADELDARINDFPFNNVLDLYRRRRDAKSFEDKLQEVTDSQAEQLKAMSAALEAKAIAADAQLGSMKLALTILGCEESVSDSVGDTLVQQTTEAVGRESKLRNALSIALEREKVLVEALRESNGAASAQQHVEAALRTRLTVASNVSDLLQMNVAEAEERQSLIMRLISNAPFSLIAGESLPATLQLCSLLNCTVAEVRFALGDRLKSLTRLEAYAASQVNEVVWYRDPIAVIAVQRLHAALTSNVSESSPFTRRCSGDEQQAFLIRTLDLAYEELQSVRATCLQKDGLVEALTTLVHQCGNSLRGTWQRLRSVTPRATPPSVEEPLLSETQRRENLLTVCRGLDASAATCVGQQKELTELLQSTLSTLHAVSTKAAPTIPGDGGGDRTMHQTLTTVTDVGIGNIPAFSQVPQLAQQLGNEVTQLRGVAASMPALVVAVHQRDALIRTIEACCATLRRPVSDCSETESSLSHHAAAGSGANEKAGDGRVQKALPAGEAAAAALSEISSSVGSTLQAFIQSTTQSINVLEELAGGERTGMPVHSRPTRLLDVTDGVRFRVRQLEREQRNTEEQREREQQEREMAVESSEKALLALRERCEATETQGRNLADELATLQQNVTRVQNRWDALVQVFGAFTQQVHEAATERTVGQSTLTEELVPLVQRCLSLQDSDRNAVEILRARLSEVRDACQRRCSDLRRAAAANETLKQQGTDLSATIASQNESIHKLTLKLEALQTLTAKMEANAADQVEAAAQEKNAAAAAHRATLAEAEVERLALEAKINAAELEVARLTTQLSLNNQRSSNEQTRMSQLERARQDQEDDILACLTAVGNVRSLAEVGEMVSTYRSEYKKRSLEAKEARHRRELVQEWATTMGFVPVEMSTLWTLVGAAAQQLPGLPLREVAREIQRLQRNVADAERMLGASLSDALADGDATRAALLRMVSQVHGLFFPPVSDLSSPARLTDSADLQAARSLSTTRRKGTTSLSWCACPEKLVDAVARLLDHQQNLQEAEEGALRSEQLWSTTVVRTCGFLHSALSAAGSFVTYHDDNRSADDGDGEECASPSLTTPQDTQQAARRALELVAKHAVEHMMERANLLRQLRALLQSCLSTTEASLETLVASVVREMETLRRASHASSQHRRNADNAVAVLTSILHDATDALPDSASFLLVHSTQEQQQLEEHIEGVEAAAGAGLVRKCKAYAKECSRLSALEGALWRVLKRGCSSEEGADLGAASSLVGVAERVTTELASLRDSVVPKLNSTLRSTATNALVLQETVERMEVCLVELTSRVKVCYAVPLADLKELHQQTSTRADNLELLLSQKTEQLRQQQNAYDTLEGAALRLAPGQEKCRQLADMGTRGTNCLTVAAPRSALEVVEQEADVLLQLLEAYNTLATQSTQRGAELEQLKAVHNKTTAQQRGELSAARDQLGEWGERTEGFASFAKEMCRLLKLPLQSLTGEGEPAASVDVVRAALPQITSAVAHLARQATAQQDELRRFEGKEAAAAQAAEEMRQRSATAEAQWSELQRRVETHERAEADEKVATLEKLRSAAEAHQRLMAALSASTVPPLAGVSLSLPAMGDSTTASPVPVSRAAWTAVAEAVEWLVHDVDRRVASEANAAAEHSTLQSHVTQLNKELRRKKTQEAQLLARLNETLTSTNGASSASLEDAVAAVEGHMEGCARQTHALEDRVKEQEQMQRELSTALHKSQSKETLHEAQAAAAEEKEKELLERLTELQQLAYNAFAAARARATTVLAGGNLPPAAQDGTAERHYDGVIHLVEQLVLRLQESSQMNTRLLDLKKRNDEIQRGSETAETGVKTLLTVLYEELLPQLVDDMVQNGNELPPFQHVDAAPLSAASPSPHASGGSRVSAAVIDTAVQTIREASRCVRDLRDDMKGVVTFVESHFGVLPPPPTHMGFPVTTRATISGVAVTRELEAHLSLTDTVHATAKLMRSVVEAKCTSTVNFLQAVEADLLGRPSAFAKLSFTTLRPAPFVEWLRQLTEGLRTMHARSERHRRQMRRLPMFMDALVEIVHSHGGRVDLPAFEHPTALAASVNDTSFTSRPFSADDDFAELHEEWQELEQEAVLDGVQALLTKHDKEMQRITADLQDVTSQYRQFSQEQAAAEHIVEELRQRVQHKVLEDDKLEASLRELDRHLDAQARELGLKYQADQDAIVKRFSAMRSTIYAAMNGSYAATAAAPNVSTAYWSPRSSERGRSLSRIK